MKFAKCNSHFTQKNHAKQQHQAATFYAEVNVVAMATTGSLPGARMFFVVWDNFG